MLREMEFSWTTFVLPELLWQEHLYVVAKVVALAWYDDTNSVAAATFSVACQHLVTAEQWS